MDRRRPAHFGCAVPGCPPSEAGAAFRVHPHDGRIRSRIPRRPARGACHQRRAVQAHTFFFIFPVTESVMSVRGLTRHASTIDSASSSAVT